MAEPPRFSSCATYWFFDPIAAPPRAAIVVPPLGIAFMLYPQRSFLIMAVTGSRTEMLFCVGDPHEMI